MTLLQPKLPAAFRKHVFSLLGETYGDKTLVLCPTVFVKLLNGDHKAAILLSQILYWSDRTKDPDGWFYKSYADWQRETGLSEAQVRRIVSGDTRTHTAKITLCDLGVETLLRKVKRTGAPTLHYRINQARFLDALHAFLGQGDSQQSAGSIPNNVQDEPPANTGFHSQQSEPSLIASEINDKDPAVEDQPSQKPNPADDDSDLGIYLTYESRFGKLKSPCEGTLRTELARLGAATVCAVLERCATRGRSWNYVLRALTNEASASPATVESPAALQNGVFPAFESELEANYPVTPEQAVLPVSERLQTPWEHGFKPGSTVADVWEASRYQLAAQLDSATFQMSLRDAVLVDFQPETRSFVVVAHSAAACEMCHHRLRRTIQRILRDTCGQAVEVQFLTVDEWREQAPMQPAVEVA